MRYYAYAGTSMVLATGVIIRAVHQRANFYSACVYLAQSNACLMILTNLGLLGVCTMMLAFQRLLYGPLRPIEVEQLYEKAWFAITETCLAMTIFREEVGGWFLVMFVCLLIGKVWGWIGEGRVDILEQQPPANPRLFHARLSFSLAISTLFDMYMLRYSIQTVLLQARPNMMVMFAFEFAVLTVTSLSTAARYSISLHEAAIIKQQTSSRRIQMRRDRDQSQQQLDTAVPSSSMPSVDAMRAHDDIELMDIDVPGWEEKGRWIFYLDLTTDFLKLVLYLSFFCVLCMFYGMPIHIIRDVALTVRSFYKRINDFLRYRQATRDMNARYPDATVDEVAREDVCIICREDMRPWPQAQDQGSPPAGNAIDERLRPKKLPCGHVLHFVCLRSWLERQQNCPTCRRPVLVSSTQGLNPGATPLNQDDLARINPEQPQAPAAGHGEAQQPVVAQNVFQFGPFRLAFGARHADQNLANQGNTQPPQPNLQARIPAVRDFQRFGNAIGFLRQTPTNQPAIANSNPMDVPLQLQLIEQQLMRELSVLRLPADQLFLVRALQSELARLRAVEANPGASISTGVSTPTPYRPQENIMQGSQPLHTPHIFSTSQPQQALGSRNRDLPSGLAIPDGWSILPLQRLPSVANLRVSPANLALSSGLDPHSLDRSDASPVIQSQPRGLDPGQSTAELHDPQATPGMADQESARLVAASVHGDINQSPRALLSSSPMTHSERQRMNETQADHSTGCEQAELGMQMPISIHDGSFEHGQSHTLPAWRSNLRGLSASQESKQDEWSGETRAADEELSSNRADPTSVDDNPQAKGKGKVVTVEDEVDEI